MKKIMMSFPQIVIEQRELEVTDEQYFELTDSLCDSERAEFIWSKMTQQEKDWTQGKKWIESAIDAGYCGLSTVVKASSNDG